MKSRTMVAEAPPEAVIPEAAVPLAPVQKQDLRRAERHEIIYPAQVSVVGTAQVLQGTIQNVSEGGTQIRLSEPLPPPTLVKIEYNDNLLLGEVVYCRQDQSSWLVGLRVEHGLFGLKALSDAMQGF